MSVAVSSCKARISLGGAISAPSSLIGVIQTWGTWKTRIFHPYRPERYYMRGPGPKSRDKAQLSAQSSQMRSSLRGSDCSSPMHRLSEGSKQALSKRSKLPQA